MKCSRNIHAVSAGSMMRHNMLVWLLLESVVQTLVFREHCCVRSLLVLTNTDLDV